jgi:steroid delta-isomerase
VASAEDIRSTVRSYIGRFSANDREGWVALFTDDATVEDPIGSEVHAGKAAIGSFWDASHGLADAISLELSGPICVAANEAAFPFRILTTLGGATFEMDAADVMVFGEDARIRGQRAFWDVADMRPAAE